MQSAAPIVALVTIITIAPQLAILEAHLAIPVRVNQFRLSLAQVQLLAHQSQLSQVSPQQLANKNLRKLVIVLSQHRLHTNLNQLKLAIVHLVRRQVAHHQAQQLHIGGNNQCLETS